MRTKKKVQTLEEYLNEKTKKDILKEKYKKSIGNARGDSENEEDLIDRFKLNVGKYSLRARIKNSSWVKSGRPASKAISWLFKDVFTNAPIYRYNRQLLYQGGLFAFKYFNPKYKGTDRLPWFDKYPLVLSLGPVVCKSGIRNIGFNLHLLPPKIRIITVCAVFEMYKKLYRYQIFFNNNNEKPVQIRYQEILKALDMYGIRFAVRMYIPQRMNQIIAFPYKDWSKAIFIPSQGYDSIRANKLIQEWQKYQRKHGWSAKKDPGWKTLI